MSRDPEDGKAHDPKILHKYLYAGGDPVNVADPTGKGFVDTALAYIDEAVDTAAERLLSKAMVKVYICVAMAILGKIIGGSGTSGIIGGGLGTILCKLFGG